MAAWWDRAAIRVTLNGEVLPAGPTANFAQAASRHDDARSESGSISTASRGAQSLNRMTKHSAYLSSLEKRLTLGARPAQIAENT